MNTEKMQTFIKILDEEAEVPKRAMESDSGYDVKMIGIHKIVGDVAFFKTGIAIKPPPGHYFEIVPRSSISKLPLSLANSVGIIDEQYRGELLIPVRFFKSTEKVTLGKTSSYREVFKLFEKTYFAFISDVAETLLEKKPVLFQLILRKRHDTEFTVVDELEETERGDGGFGSTDK